MDCSPPGLPVPHRILEFAQVHVPWIGDALFYSWSQSLPASGSFPMSWLFTSDVQNIGASTSVLPVNIQGWSPLKLTGLISLLSRGFSGVFSSTTVQRHQFFGILPLRSGDISTHPFTAASHGDGLPRWDEAQLRGVLITDFWWSLAKDNVGPASLHVAHLPNCSLATVWNPQGSLLSL